MEVQVYHSQNVRDTYFYRDNRLFEDETDILDMIYNDSQNEDADWRTRRQRSTSVGDIIVLDSKVFIVASCGFDAIY